MPTQLHSAARLHWRSRQDPNMTEPDPRAADGGGGGERVELPGPECSVRMTRPVVLPETFDGTGNWSEWIENVASVYGWDNTLKLKWLPVRLTGRAQKALQRIPEATAGTYEATRETLKASQTLSGEKRVWSNCLSQVVQLIWL